MLEALGPALGILASPVLLFFLLGILAALIRSDLDIPPAIGKTLALYLMVAIGFKGGTALSAGVPPSAGLVAVLGIALALATPLIAYPFLRRIVHMPVADAAAIAACYGSVSVVTFLAALEHLERVGTPAAGYLVAILALMETPAIVMGLLLAHRAGVSTRGMKLAGALRESIVSGSVVLLVGGLLIGWLTGARGVETLGAFLVDPFQGVLAIFLLDMGLLVVRRLREARGLTAGLVAYGLLAPPLLAAFALGVAVLFRLDVATATVLAVLAASASYIAAPAAIRMALPQADAGRYMTLSLGVTFPFNVIVGIPLYHRAAVILLGGM